VIGREDAERLALRPQALAEEVIDRRKLRPGAMPDLAQLPALCLPALYRL